MSHKGRVNIGCKEVVRCAKRGKRAVDSITPLLDRICSRGCVHSAAAITRVAAERKQRIRSEVANGQCMEGHAQA